MVGDGNDYVEVGRSEDGDGSRILHRCSMAPGTRWLRFRPTVSIRLQVLGEVAQVLSRPGPHRAPGGA